MARKTIPLEVRFWKYVEFEPNSGCWLWSGGVAHLGYGTIGLGSRAMKKISAHRASWQIHYGPIPAGMSVLHRCDIPCCVNPAHLFLGTQADNMADKSRKGRAVGNGLLGEERWQSKVTEAEVRLMRELHRDHSATGTELAKMFGLSKSAACRIVSKTTWQHIE